jgi:hypothetical protein
VRDVQRGRDVDGPGWRVHRCNNNNDTTTRRTTTAQHIQ